MNVRAALTEHAESAHSGLRSASSTALVVAVTAALLAALLVPEFARGLALPAWVASTVLGGFAAVVMASAVAHARLGFHSRTYQAPNLLETAWAVLGSLGLILASGPRGYFFWSVFIAVCVQAGSFGHNRRFNRSLFVLGPLGLALGFIALRGDWMGAGITVLAALVSLAAWQTTLASTRCLADRMAARRMAEARERDLAVLADRERIARDLHDGLGAVLTGLLYRVQEQGSGAGLDDEGVADRIRECIDELRGVVWVLREDHRSFGELVAWLQNRCADLCAGEVELVFHASEGERRLDGALQMHLARMVLEAVRNAVHHGGARRIEVSLEIGSEIRVVVRDDGSGFGTRDPHPRTGGLANLRSRSSTLGGTLSVATSGQGTELRFQIPAVGGGA